MPIRRTLLTLLGFLLLTTLPALGLQQPAGSIRGLVLDGDFGAPLPAGQVAIIETGQKAETNDQGNYLFSEVKPGTYTLVFSKQGYVRQVRTDVLVSAGSQTDVDASLAGEFTEMEEFVVEDILQLGGGAEAALLNLRFESPSLLDSISSDLMSKAGASDAASALQLVSGATVQDGKFAVIRGLPDRYVSSQLNGVRLPTTDEDKRAVELDQFPSTVIDSIQVSKTFTPDSQGDASGGAVDVRLKGIPDEFVLELKMQLDYNSLAGGRDDFLSYEGGGVDFWGKQGGDRGIQFENLGSNWDGAVGTSRIDSPVDSKWSLAIGGKQLLDSGLTVGAFASFYYERDSSFYDDGINDSLWVTTPGAGLSPEYSQGAPDQGDFLTALFDIVQGKQSVQWGNLATVGVESDAQALRLTYLYTRTAEDVATLAENTRGKEYYFPGYDPNDPTAPGNTQATTGASPYLRTETLEYTERTTSSIQLAGDHELPLSGLGIGESFSFREPVIDWFYAISKAHLSQPDKRQFGAQWNAASFSPGVPPFSQDETEPAFFSPYKPAANFTIGNAQRIFKDIREDSNQWALNLTLPFDQWSGDEGYVKAGLFDDQVDRHFDQDTFSNFGEPTSIVLGDFFTDSWSSTFPDEIHSITESESDVDYDGELGIRAVYGMFDLPLSNDFNLIAGARIETTSIRVINDPEQDAVYYPLDFATSTALTPGVADVDFEQDDVLPSVSLVYDLTDQLTLRGSYSQTVARQTFKELTPIVQQEFLGGPVFIGNSELRTSALDNYDLRIDWTPSAGSFFSLSWFYKQVEDPIEYVQIVQDFTFTSAINYPEGKLSGFELEARQDLGQYWNPLLGLSAGANATFIRSEVTLPSDEAEVLAELDAPSPTRDMTNAPEHLYNIYLTYNFGGTRTEAALFYTVKGDTLVAGAAADDNNFVPSLYEKETGTLNFSLSRALGSHSRIKFQAKNLLDAKFEEVYRSPYIPGDATRTSYSRGMDFSLSLSLFL